MATTNDHYWQRRVRDLQTDSSPWKERGGAGGRQSRVGQGGTARGEARWGRPRYCWACDSPYLVPSAHCLPVWSAHHIGASPVTGGDTLMVCRCVCHFCGRWCCRGVRSISVLIDKQPQKSNQIRFSHVCPWFCLCVCVCVCAFVCVYVCACTHGAVCAMQTIHCSPCAGLLPSLR